jgi:Zn-dependent peptidase ImmA (M78 family)
MNAHELTDRASRIAGAISQAYEDADLTPPSILDTSKIVPLRGLLAGQGLRHTERKSLTRHDAARYFAEVLPYDVEVDGGADDELSGYLYATNSLSGWVLVNQREPIARRRYTVAHELGHFILHARPRLEDGAGRFSESHPHGPHAEPESPDAFGQDGQVQIDGQRPVNTSDTEHWEVEANQFAAALLMPEALCRGLAAEYGPRCGDRRKVLAKRLGSELLVSQQAMTYQLGKLGLGRA